MQGTASPDLALHCKYLKTFLTALFLSYIYIFFFNAELCVLEYTAVFVHNKPKIADFPLLIWVLNYLHFKTHK